MTVQLVHVPHALEAHETMCERLAFGDTEGHHYDFVYGTDVGLHNVVIEADKFLWDYDLKYLWLAKSRWNTMVRQYLSPEGVTDWLDKIDDRLHGRGRGIAVMKTNDVQGRGTGRNVRRRWGSCMISYSFRSNPIPTLTMHSRTTYFGYLAAMDITVAHVLAQEIGKRLGMKPSDMRFVWFIELAQFHGFRSLAWMLEDPKIKARMDNDVDNRMSFPLRGSDAVPGYRKALDGYSRLVKSDREGKLYGDEAFSSFCRVRRRFHTEIMGPEYAKQFEGGDLRGRPVKAFAPLPSLGTRRLTLDPLWR